MIDGLTYYCDGQRHLVCVPYTEANLHLMAVDLGIKRCWFHRGMGQWTALHRATDPDDSIAYMHYDIPKRRLVEIAEKCNVVRPRDILSIIRGEWVLT